MMHNSFIPVNDPYYPTPNEVVLHKLDLLALKDGETVFDLGCGDAIQLIMACTKANVQCIGYEIFPEAIKDAKINIQKADLSNQIEIREEDIYKADISNANALILYFSRSVLGALSLKLEKELPVGARIVTHQFDIPGWTEELKKEVMQKNGALETIYLYRKI
ncbi:class I SAM-dependent methyltransferase [Aquimarina sp. 2201CG14-23]|uniref:class I SAM-dependent methyltransferase n=1 Tax=Aquimarina mycalae TaxID=3040073 RepID=UPI002477F73F|nr:methyltransferase domain-containing protein [Aquimarina sp. 2201CG14-23]MDH7446985.1 methyltransferase domain-containing protein [Aquimarina sp. 2201CG14-23]